MDNAQCHAHPGYVRRVRHFSALLPAWLDKISLGEHNAWIRGSPDWICARVKVK